MRTQWLAAGLLGAALVVGMASCGDQSPTALAPSAGAISLQIVSGNGQSGPAGAQLPSPIVVRVMDEHRRYPVRDMPVNFVVTAGGGSFYAGTGISDEHGYASDYWTLGPTAGPQSAEARAVTGRTGVQQVFGTFTATAVPGTATKLAFTGQPGGVAAGAAIAPAVVVTVQDALGNTVPSSTAGVTLAIASGTGTTGAVLGGTQTQAAVNGVATFADLTIDKAGSGYTLTATAASLAAASSNAFAVSAGVAATLAFTVQPSDVVAGAAIASAVVVTVRDAQGNSAPGATTSITLALTGGTGTTGAVLGGTLTQTAVNGVATFGNLTIDKAGSGYTLTATGTGLASASSSAFAVNAGVATKLAFTVQPSDAVAGAAIAPAVVVTVQDALSNAATSSAVSVTLAITSGTGMTGAVLGGTLTQTAVNGVATFGNLAIDKAGSGYALTATATGLASAGSGAFAVSAGAAAKLAFTVQPSDVVAGAAIAPGVVVAVQDAGGNTVPSATTSIVLAVTSGTGTTGAVLGGTVTQAAVNGVATFGNLTLDKAGGGYTLTATATPLASATSAPFSVSGTEVGFVQAVAAGESQTCGLTTAGVPYCWGRGLEGQLGNGSTASANTPVAVFFAQTFNRLSAGFNHACGLTTDNRAWCWGDNTLGQMGAASYENVRTTPVPVWGFQTFQSLSAGGNHTCGVTTGSVAYCWGEATDGQLGAGEPEFDHYVIPLVVQGGYLFRALSAGGRHTCGVTYTGEAYCWGYGSFGQLGDESTAREDTPVLVHGSHTFHGLSAGDDHTCALEDQTAYCWGRGLEGQRGYGDWVSGWLPTPVLGNHFFRTLTAGGRHTCGVTDTGEAYCWGAGSFGQLGNGSTASANTPVKVSGGLAFASLSAGGNHTCGVTTGGVAYCWGWGYSGQLGDARYSSGHTTPVAVLPPPYGW